MANSYVQASFEIPVKDVAVTKKRMEAIRQFVMNGTELPRELFRKPKTIQKEIASECGLGFSWEIFGQSVLFHHDESIDLERAVSVAQILLDLDDNDDIFTTEWAIICDKARPDEFGGGAVAFDRHRSEWMHTGTMARRCAARLKRTRTKP